MSVLRNRRILANISQNYPAPDRFTNLLFWFDFGDPNTLYTDNMANRIQQSGDLIYGVADKSGYNNHAIQSTSELRPTYKDNVANGLSAALFSNDDLLPLSAGLGALNNVSGATAIAVVSAVTVGASNNIFNMSTGAAAGIARFTLRSSSSKYGVGGRRLDANSYAKLESAAAYSTGELLIHTGVLDYANSNAYGYKNNTLVASTTSFIDDGNTSATDSLWGGVGNSFNGQEGWNGYIHEVVIYNRAITMSELNDVHAYLNNKWRVY